MFVFVICNRFSVCIEKTFKFFFFLYDLEWVEDRFEWLGFRVIRAIFWDVEYERSIPDGMDRWLMHLT